jgi:hypothetical protein
MYVCRILDFRLEPARGKKDSMIETTRRELKFYISPLNAAILEKKLQYLMTYDLNSVGGMYNVKSLYFDDSCDSALRDKMNGVEKAPKFRIRMYNDDFRTKKLEMKHKKGDIVTKKSVALSDEEYEQFIKCTSTFSNDFPELAGKVLKPKVIISYDRKAFVYEPGNVRITFDSNIKASRNRNPCLTKPAAYVRLPAPENVVFEVKYTGVFPLHLRGVFQEASARQSISKYAMGRLKSLF